MNKNVAVLGASEKPNRYSYMAIKLLEENGYRPIPVHPKKETIAGLRTYPSLRDIPEPVDTVTVYVNPTVSSGLTDDFLTLKPRRVILNPGTENPQLTETLEQNGIEVIRACTLVMLHTGQF